MTSILKVDTIQDADGNNIINESGNTITIGASGDTTNIIGTLNKDGVAVASTPSFMAYNSTVTSMTNNSPTKVLFQTENFDVGSCYDTSTSRFTPTTSGKYFFNASVSVNSTGNFDKNDVNFYKNGSAFANFRTYHTSYTTSHGSVIIEANGSSDYFEIYYEQNSGGALNTINNQSTFFSAYRIIGA
jgi:hypothetical protein